MRITQVTAYNWRNFKKVDFPIENRLFVVGPNASGKSNLLDLFRSWATSPGPAAGCPRRSSGAAASARCAACSPATTRVAG